MRPLSLFELAALTGRSYRPPISTPRQFLRAAIDALDEAIASADDPARRAMYEASRARAAAKLAEIEAKGGAE